MGDDLGCPDGVTVGDLGVRRHSKLKVYVWFMRVGKFHVRRNKSYKKEDTGPTEEKS